MSEPPIEATTPSFLLDGELPRLGGGASAPSATPFAASPASLAPPPPSTPRAAGPSPMLSAPGSAPVLGLPEVPNLPIQHAPEVDLPTLPSVTPAVHQAAPAATDAEATTSANDDDHPMAHLMPQKSAPSEASKRAAEIRAAKKAKARKVKIGVAVGALAVSAIVGPPLGKWFVNAINEAGSTSTDVDG
jgi:hypothetical protein